MVLWRAEFRQRALAGSGPRGRRRGLLARAGCAHQRRGV